MQSLTAAQTRYYQQQGGTLVSLVAVLQGVLPLKSRIMQASVTFELSPQEAKLEFVQNREERKREFEKKSIEHIDSRKLLLEAPPLAGGEDATQRMNLV